MSLILHLPLNKDLRNIGLFNSKPTPNNVELSTNGVFNNCYKFSNNVNSYINVNVKTVDLFGDNASYSVAFWVKLSAYPSTTPGGIFGSNKYTSEQTTGNYKGGGFGVLLYSNYITIIHANSTANQGKQVNNIPLDTWLHIAICYNNNGNIVRCYVNGEKQLETAFTIDYSTNGANFIIGRNSQGGCTNPSEKYISDFRMYDHCLTESDIQKIYEGKFSNIVLSFPLNKDFRNIGLVNAETSKLGNASIIEDQNFGGCLQAGDGTQTANGVRCNTNLLDELSEQKFSCSVWVKPKGSHVHYNGTFFSSGDWNSKSWAFGVNSANTQVDMFGPRYNTYVSCNVPLNEWTNLISIYNNREAKLYKNGQYVKTYTFPSSYVFSSNTTWCAIGRETYANGYFSFNGNIADLRVYNLLLTEKDIQRIYHQKLIDLLPSEYEKLEYIEGTGTQHINTGLKFNAETDYVKVTFKGNDTSNNGMIFANTGSKYFWLYYYSAGINVYADNGNGQKSVYGIPRDLNKHIVEFKEKHYYIDGVDKGIIANSYTETWSNMYIFSYGSSYYFKGRIYNVEVKKNDGTHKIFIPAKRKNDNVIGMFDMVSRQFFTNAGTGNFNGA